MISDVDSINIDVWNSLLHHLSNRNLDYFFILGFQFFERLRLIQIEVENLKIKISCYEQN